ncbi:MAG: sulfatase [Candidatus Thorarchaeota archaeon]
MSEKMNVLFIISDQQRYDHMSCSGNKILRTPNLDRLSSEGIHFTNAFCTNPMCMPNRATLLTGLYPNVHGVRSNGMILSNDVPTITQTLVKSGWYTAAFGKLHHQFNVAPYKAGYKSAECFYDWVFPKKGDYPVLKNFPIPYYGYQEVEMVLGHGACLCGHYLDWLEKRSPEHANKMRERWNSTDNFFSVFTEHEIPAELYSSAYVVERTTAFIERHANGDYGEKPFYVHCGFPDPHQPVWPPGMYKTLYSPEDIELPESFKNLDNLRNHPYLAPYINVMPGAMLRETTEEEAKLFIAYTYGIVSLIDDSIGQILNALEKLGYADNTIIVYTSDHGGLMGDQGMLFKGPSTYMGVLHIPMIWKVPKITNSATTNALISSIDYPKTILNLLGIKEKRQPPDMQGYDITSVLRDPRNPEMHPRDCCLIEEDEEIGPLNVRLRHLITNDHKLTIYEGIQEFGDLFDRKNDPNELYNLWFDSDHKNLRFSLVNRLLQECLKSQTRYPKRIAGT